MLTSTDFSGLLSRRFFRNFFPIPAMDLLSIGMKTPAFSLLHITTPNIPNPGSRNPDRINQTRINQTQTSQANITQIALSDYWNKQPVVLAFTRIFTEKQYCPFCFPHIKELNERYHEFRDRGVELLMITSTDERQSQVVVRDLGLKMPLLSDPSCHVFQAYRTGQALGAPLPAQFVLDRQGQLRYKHWFSFLDHNASVDRLLDILEQI